MKYLFLATLLFINNFFNPIMATEEPELPDEPEVGVEDQTAAVLGLEDE